MKTALVASLIANVALLIGAGLMISMQSHKVSRLSHELDKASHEAAKWKQAAVKSYRLRVIFEDATADTMGRISTDLPSYCRSVPYMMAQMMLSNRESLGLHKIVDQVNAKLNEGDLKEPLDDAIWMEK